MSEEQLNSAIGDPPQMNGAMYAQTTGDPPPAEEPPPDDDDLEQVPRPDGDPPPNLPSGGSIGGDPPPN
ncbi:MAG TPA: hypothetical protein VF528_14805 [Pyrinomonadaceae bacterium]|jgi:hypothetical protein